MSSVALHSTSPSPRPLAVPLPAAARRRLPFRLTRTGLSFLLMTLFIFLAMYNSGTNLLYFVFGLMVAALVVSFFFSVLCLRKLSIRRDFGDHMVAGEPADMDYHVTNQKRFWPCLSLRIQEFNDGFTHPPDAFMLHIAQKKTALFSARLVLRRRGVLRLSRVRFSTAFPFGFLSYALELDFPQELIVYPRIGMLNRHLALQYRESIESGTMTSNVRGGIDEFYGLREYRPGDNIRAIHWRSTARTNQLMIRELAANSPPQMIVVLNLRAAVDPGQKRDSVALAAEAERAIEIAASLICYGFFENFAVGLAIAGIDTEVPPSPQMGRDARSTLLKRLAILDVASIRPDAGIAYPNRLAGRAQWIIVTLHASDPYRDLLSPNAPGGAAPGTSAGALRSGNHTLLAMDDPDSTNWVHFLTAQDTLRLLRDHGASASE